MIIRRKTLQLSDDELKAVLQIVVPFREIEGLDREKSQEIIIKWLFSNGFSINHEFEFWKDDDDLFCIIRQNKVKNCQCCSNDSNSGVGGGTSKQNGWSGSEKVFRPPEPPYKNGTNKIAPITVQPTIITVDPSLNGKHNEKLSGCAYLKRECGLCIVQICSQI
ncbi:unnamed protein product [Caenorhabditis bovis]|uniref:Uncharacterized protein n=1 Tax=Caenorhabditis bovis TaxID=2654633 RepID=A0A8S1EQG9_9PELO|nr:unnamed protein product [Caenorhabditis bovis]